MSEPSRPYYNSHSARKHATPTLAADDDAAIAAGILYKAVVFFASGSLDIVDSAGNTETVTMPAGGIYPVQNYGATDTAGTTLTADQFACLYD